MTDLISDIPILDLNAWFFIEIKTALSRMYILEIILQYIAQRFFDISNMRNRWLRLEPPRMLYISLYAWFLLEKKFLKQKKHVDHKYYQWCRFCMLNTVKFLVLRYATKFQSLHMPHCSCCCKSWYHCVSFPYSKYLRPGFVLPPLSMIDLGAPCQQYIDQA